MDNHLGLWCREVGLLREAVLTPSAIQGAPDSSLPWIPHTLTPLYGSDAYAALTSRQRLSYNHFYAQQLLYEFVWVERDLIQPPLRKLLSIPGLEKDLQEILISFISDEKNHIESFLALAAVTERLIQSSRMGAGRFRPPVRVRVLAALAGRHPRLLTFWSEVIAEFEEYAISIAQEYKRDTSVDPLFKKLFLLHARDEARHRRLDDLFSVWLRSGARAYANKLNDQLRDSFIRAYRSDTWGLDAPIRALAQAFPEVSGRYEALLAEARAMRRTKA